MGLRYNGIDIDTMTDDQLRQTIRDLYADVQLLKNDLSKAKVQEYDDFDE